MDERHNLVILLLADIQQRGFTHPHLLAQCAALVFALLLALWGNHYLKPHLGLDQRRWRRGGEGLMRIFFPLNALLLVWLCNFLLRFFWPQPHKLLDVAAVLLLAMANIRVLVYLLRYAFRNPPWLQRAEPYLAGLIWLLYALHVVGILPELADELRSIQFTMGKSTISLLGVINGVVSVAGTLIVAMWLGRLFEARMMAASVVDMNLRVVSVKIARTLLVVLAVIVALSLVGIDLTVLSVFGGALGVGLGFGLQKIASNYVSGFIILLDRSVKLGDLVQVDNRQGVITGLTSRYVVVKGSDGTEALVPNETLITSTVVNQSYNARDVWVKIPISVAYESDLELVMKLLVDTTAGIDRIKSDPPPRAYIENFGANGVDMSLGFWLKDPENGSLGLRSEINRRIWAAFREHRISIPFNRLDVVHFRPSMRTAGDGNLQGLAGEDAARQPDRTDH